MSSAKVHNTPEACNMPRSLPLSSSQDVLVHQKFVNIVYIILLAIAQHAAYLLFNFVVILFVLRLPLAEAIAVGIMSSQVIVGRGSSTVMRGVMLECWSEGARPG